jgi:DNA primase
MGILDDDVAKVRDATDLVALASEHLALKRVGSRYVGLCPFHSEKTPSFSINPEIGRFFCFGCQANGDAISFVREVEHLDFVEAVERLGARAGITLHYDSNAVTKDRSKRDRLVAVVGAAVDHYHRLLLDAPEGGTARGYLRSRGFGGDHARQFHLGWAPDAWDSLSVHLQREKFSRDDIVTAGLAFVNKANRLQDQFRARLLFPIYDSRGDPVGFGGRTLTGDGPKYKNSPETPIYQKSRLLYGLNWAKSEIVARGQVIICEGYTDVMAFALAGVPNAVATCGTALADDHFAILKNLARNVVLAYDGDAAGRGAAEKWYGWEQRFEIQLEVADLPAGRDPADVWRDDPAALVAAIERAEPFLRFRLDRLLAAADLASLEGRARAGERGAAIVAEHPSDLVRDQYVMWLAGNLDIDADRLRDAVSRQVGRPREEARVREQPRRAAPDDERASGAPTSPTPPLRVDRREVDLLRWAIHEPELVVDWLEPYLFEDAVVRGAFERVAESRTIHEAIESSEGQVRELLERVAVEEAVTDDEPETLRARLMVNAVVPPAQRVRARMVRADNPRAAELSVLLDALADSRAAGDWEAVLHNANQLLGWVAVGSRGADAA